MRGGEAGKVDAQGEPETGRIPEQAEEAAEEQGVEDDGDALDEDGRRQPQRGSLSDQLERVPLPRESRRQEKQGRDQDEEDDRGPPGVTPARCLGVAQRFFLPPRR